MITQERLKELLRYDPATGKFIWLRGHQKVRIGDEAGSPGSSGYTQIKIDGRLYGASRLAWLYVTGHHPSEFVDHRNRVRSDNSWENLRMATRQQNAGNCGMRRHNKSGFKGIYWCGQAQRWRATIQVDGRPKVLGNFRSKEAAHEAYKAKAIEVFGEFANFG